MGVVATGVILEENSPTAESWITTLLNPEDSGSLTCIVGELRVDVLTTRASGLRTS
jgi:hypothetical protein